MKQWHSLRRLKKPNTWTYRTKLSKTKVKTCPNCGGRVDYLNNAPRREFFSWMSLLKQVKSVYLSSFWLFFLDAQMSKCKQLGFDPNRLLNWTLLNYIQLVPRYKIPRPLAMIITYYTYHKHVIWIMIRIGKLSIRHWFVMHLKIKLSKEAKWMAFWKLKIVCPIVIEICNWPSYGKNHFYCVELFLDAFC